MRHKFIPFLREFVKKKKLEKGLALERESELTMEAHLLSQAKKALARDAERERRESDAIEDEAQLAKENHAAAEKREKEERQKGLPSSVIAADVRRSYDKGKGKCDGILSEADQQ